MQTYQLSNRRRLMLSLCSCLLVLFSFVGQPTIVRALAANLKGGSCPLITQQELDEESGFPVRSTREYRSDWKTFMRLSRSEDPQLQRNAIFNLCELHSELVRDPDQQTDRQLQGLRVTAANRLKAFTKHVHKQEAARQRELSKAGEPHGTESTFSSQTSNLANREFGDRPSPQPAAASGDEDAWLLQEIQLAAAESNSLMNSASGGPNRIYDFVGGHFAPPWDHGPELVNLIQTVIDPQFWRINGGTGTIHYYRPLQALVIGASLQVHQDTADLLRRLRAAGR